MFMNSLGMNLSKLENGNFLFYCIFLQIYCTYTYKRDK